MINYMRICVEGLIRRCDGEGLTLTGTAPVDHCRPQMQTGVYAT